MAGFPVLGHRLGGYRTLGRGMVGRRMVGRTAHRRSRRDLHAYLDGELDPDRAYAVARHLDDCWPCSGEAEVVRRIKHALARSGDRRPTELAVARLQRWAAR